MYIWKECTNTFPPLLGHITWDDELGCLSLQAFSVRRFSLPNSLFQITKKNSQQKALRSTGQMMIYVQNILHQLRSCE